MGASLSVLMRIIDAIGTSDAGLVEDYLERITDAVRLISMSFAQLTQTRRDVHRNAVGDPLTPLCIWGTDTPEFLYGTNLRQQLKEKGDAKRALSTRRGGR